ncbi:MAG: tRNA (guanosine(46)-N7)-methyltransferase TrmB [Lachnospiraceae bacterium]|nr:tRNA (guanosine(46)-N7)-methyltransferase TrmB [Lachnospiraceae bacterium]
MRLRNIPGSRETIAASEYVVHEDVMRDKKGHWNEVFGNDQPLWLEIGMGKGRFIMEQAQTHPDTNFVGIEKYSSVLLRALEKRAVSEELNNLWFLRMDAVDITEVFGPQEVDGIYLNFSDPWPKDRHASRRLPSREFLRRYQQILKKGAHIEFKTDNRDLFTFAIECAQEEGWTIDVLTWNLHADEKLMEGNIMTEYEERFSSAGNPIFKLVITPPQA